MKTRLLLCAAASLAGVAVSSLNQAGAVQASPSPAARCESHALSPRPYLVSSAGWSRDELLLLDPLRSEVFRYSAAGEFRGSTPQAFRSALQVFPGTFLLDHLQVASDGETVLEESGHFVVLDQDRLPKELANFSAQTQTERKSGREISLGHIYQWQREGNHDLLAVAELQQPASKGSALQLRYGFVSLSFSDPTQVVTLWSRPSSYGPGQAKTFYQLGLPYIAGIGDTSYALVFDDGGKMQLLRHYADSVAFESRPLEAFSKLAANLRLSAPALPRLALPEDAVTVMKAVESASMPVGLYAKGKRLYVLSHRPGPRPWTLSVIDPERDQWLGNVDLPTTARQLSAVPGTSWAFIEKGSLEAWKRQTVYGFLTVPSEAIDSLQGCN